MPTQAADPLTAASLVDDGDAREYLCVDRFLRTLADARALQTAFELKLIDQLAGVGSTTLDDLVTRFSGDGRGLAFLVKLLAASGVLDEREGTIALSVPFRRALRYRDLLETKLEYAALVLPDFTQLFTAAVANPDAFFRQARTFRLFSYDRAQGRSAEDLEATRRWVRITTCLTRYEAPVCLLRYEFGRHARMLDIGGNSGELALQACRRHPGLSATVFDLPLVCAIGREHVARVPEAARIGFAEGSALVDPLPDGHDLVTFKSMLHDWPEAEACRLIARASEALAPGGTLLIFERGPLDPGDVPYALIPFALFFRSFRSPVLYRDELGRLGFRDVTVERIDLEMPFFLVTGRK